MTTSAPASPLLSLDHLLHLGPHDGAHRVALRAGISMAVPLLVLWSIGRMDLSVYATFGAFASLYGRTHAHRSRVRMQVPVALWLVLSITAGAAVGLSAHRAWLAVPTAAVFAAAASVLSDGMHWHPPGPLFTVFAIGACASVPTDPARVGLAAAMSAAAAAFAVLVGAAGYALPRSRALPTTSRAVDFAAVVRRPETWAAARRFALAVLVAGGIATASGMGRPYWAMVAAVVAVSGADTTARLARGVHRIVGTLVGVLVAAGVLDLGLPALATILLVVLLQMGAELFVGRHYGLALVFVTPLAILMVELARPSASGTLLRDRAIETVLGALIGIAVTLLGHNHQVRGRIHRERSAPWRTT